MPNLCLPPSDWLVPGWHVDGVGGSMTTRHGGFSVGPFARMNLGARVGDDPVAVARNRAALAAAIGVAPIFLNQVHGTTVVPVTAVDAAADAACHEADASVTSEPGLALAIQAADCLPVLFAAPGGAAIGAAHAGWRGLSAGVLEATAAAVCRAAACRPDRLSAWLGACIGPDAFEVGADVLAAFDVVPATALEAGFRPHPSRSSKWLADLAELARRRLRAAGVIRIGGGGWCTVSDPSRFFSFRRDGITGRMVAAVWIEPRASGR